jgi:hypothetical protein
MGLVSIRIEEANGPGIAKAVPAILMEKKRARGE